MAGNLNEILQNQVSSLLTLPRYFQCYTEKLALYVKLRKVNWYNSTHSIVVRRSCKPMHFVSRYSGITKLTMYCMYSEGSGNGSILAKSKARALLCRSMCILHKNT